MRRTGVFHFTALSVFLVLAGCANPPPTAAPAPQASACPATGTQMCVRPLLAPNFLSWPPGDGSQGDTTEITLPAGTLIDRFGGDGGSYFSPKGIPFGQRALPYVCDLRAYRVFRVEKSFTVIRGTIRPWFGEPGLGTQYLAQQNVGELLDAGNIVEVPVQPEDSPC